MAESYPLSPFSPVATVTSHRQTALLIQCVALPPPTRHAVVIIVQRFPLSGIFSVVRYLSIRHAFLIDGLPGELSQPPHPASGTPVHYSPSSRASQLALPDESAYRSEQGRGGYTPGHGHAQASGHTQLRALTTPYHSPQRAQPAGYDSSTPAARPFVPFHAELHETARSTSFTSTRSGYEPTHGTTQYSYPPPPPPLHQSYTVGSTSRAPPMGYQYARPIAPSYSSFGSITPSGMVAPEQPSAKYECQYCGKGFTRPSSLKVRLLAHVSGRRKFNSIDRSRFTYIATQANVVSFNTFTIIALSVDTDTGHATAFRCTFEGCNRTFSVQSNMRRHARTHLQSGNDTRESEGEEESEEGSPQPQRVQQAQISHPR